jgi:cell division protein FtsW
MLASTSGIQAEETYGDAYIFVKRQVLWLILALVAGFFTARVIDYHHLRSFVLPLAGATLVLLALVFVPGLGLTVNGSTRWLDLRVANFQPSELAKLAAVTWVAWWMSREQRWAGSFWKGFMLPFTFPGLVCLLIILEPDFGSVLLIGLVSLVVVFLGGAQIGYISTFSALGIAAFGFAVMEDDVRRRRIMAFLNPDLYARDEAYQLLQAKYAFINGGRFGAGLGESIQKRFYLPEAHTDFIFAIIGEELGAIATVGVLLLYFVIFACGLYISYRAKELFGKLLGFGITMTITLQACMNIAVVTGCMPTKGIPLPLISFGGSSLLMTFAMIGILLNIASQSGEDKEAERSRLVKKSRHWKDF